MESLPTNLLQGLSNLSPAAMMALVVIVALVVVYKALDVVGKSKGGRSK